MQSKGKFLLQATTLFGVPFALGEVWFIGGHVDTKFSVFLVFISFAGAYLWALAMWNFFSWYVARHKVDGG
jgi:hypothetical protein